MVILSGIQPSGKLHVGNYLGAVKNWLALQADTENRCFFFIADWHSLTEEYDAKEKAAQVRELAAELLACGIDPKRVTLFRQSDLPEHLELAWYFACVTPVGEMERMTQYKDKIAHGESPNVGLFTYPILQAADILVYGPQGTAKKPSIIGVPVGHDQVQHLELSNDIVRRFNKRFGAALATVKPVLTSTARVMSLKNPNHKMSKSLGGDHCLFLDDSPEVITRKLRSAVTDTGPTPSRSPSRREGEKGRVENSAMSTGVRTLFELLEAFGSKTEVTKFRKTYEAGTIKYSELKPAVAHAVSDAFSEFRKRKAELLADPKHIDAALAAGAKAARTVASETLTAVRRAVGTR